MRERLLLLELPATVELLLELLELEFELEFEFEFELEFELWALAIPANAKLMTNARNAPASNRRAIDPVVRTCPSLPKCVC